MGGFEVDPKTVAVYAEILRAQGEYQDDAIKYLDKHIGAGIKEGDGLIIPADEFNPKIVEAVRSAIKEAQSFFEESAAAMQDVADYYEKTDTDNAAELDKTYTDGEGIVIDYPDGPNAVSPPAEITDPTEVLKAPGTPEKFDDGPFEAVKAINTYTSLSKAVRELAALLNDNKDPFEEAVKEITGDWEAFAKASKACENLAKFYAHIYANLMQVQQLAYYWKGNASDIAVEFFMRTGRVFVNLDYLPQPVECTEDKIIYEDGHYWGYCQSLPLLAEEYINMASDVSESANAANGALDALIDSLLLAVGAGVAGAYGSPSGIGLIVGEGTAAAAVAKAISHVKDYTGTLGAIRDTVGIFTGMDSGSVTPMTRLDSLKIDKPYATPKGM
jgi:hypothetical protein